MSKRKDKGGGSKGAPLWMATFSDLMSLLLTFFVLLFSLSTIEEVKFVQAMSSIQGALGRIPTMFNTSFVPPTESTPQTVEPVQRQKDLERAKEAIAEKMRSKLVSQEPSRDVVVEGVKEGIRITLVGRLLFESGGSTLVQEGQRMLNQVAEALFEDFPGLHVRIEGHTDNQPVPPNASYQNNWKLAEQRAFAVMRHFRDQNNIDQDRLSVMSCGQYRPRFPNDTPENRALNRRVEIILLQGSNSETIMGALEGSGDPKFYPDLNEFVPQQR